MPRVVPLDDPEKLRPDQQVVFDAIKASRGRVVGPWPILLYSPGAATSAQELGGYLRFKTDLGPELRECVMAYAALLLDCDLEWLAHRRLAAKAGVDASTLAHMEARQPSAIAGDIGLALELTQAILDRHRVPTELFDRARDRWATPVLVDLTATVGYVSLIATIVNTFEVEPLTA